MLHRTIGSTRRIRDSGPGPAESSPWSPSRTLERILGRTGDRAGRGDPPRRRGDRASGRQPRGHRRARVGHRCPTRGWLVGCDGGRSVVRKLAGFEFPGTDPSHRPPGLVDMTGPRRCRPAGTAQAGGMLRDGPVPGRILTVDSRAAAQTGTRLDAAELQDSLGASVAPTTITGVSRASRYTDAARQATTYRGRALLAGDAAHVHSPSGGQGLNLGHRRRHEPRLEARRRIPAGRRRAAGQLHRRAAPGGAWVLDWTRAR